MAQPLENWYNGAPVITLQSGKQGGLDTWANGAPVVKKPKKDAKLRLTGVSATSAVGNFSVAIIEGTDAEVELTGVQADSAVGTFTVSGAANAAPTGVESQSAVGTFTVAGNADADLTGVESIGEVGDFTVEIISPDAEVEVGGVEAQGQTGDFTVTATGSEVPPGGGGGGGGFIPPRRKIKRWWDRRPKPPEWLTRKNANAKPIGVQAQSAVGDFVVTVTQNTAANLFGVSAAFNIGFPAVRASARPYLPGVSASATIGISEAFGAQNLTDEELSALILGPN